MITNSREFLRTLMMPICNKASTKPGFLPGFLLDRKTLYLFTPEMSCRSALSIFKKIEENLGQLMTALILAISVTQNLTQQTLWLEGNKTQQGRKLGPPSITSGPFVHWPCFVSFKQDTKFSPHAHIMLLLLQDSYKIGRNRECRRYDTTVPVI